MANLLQQSAQWQISSEVPVVWNGESYLFQSDEFTLAYRGMSFVGTASAGDRFTGIVESNKGNFLVMVDSEASPLHHVEVGGSFDWEAVDGSRLVLSNDENGSFFEYYGLDMRITPGVPVIACQEIGQVSRANVSAHNRTRAHNTRIREGEKRCLIANFNGAIPVGRKIITATWRLDDQCSASISGGAITGEGRQTEVILTAHECGRTAIECAATMDNGEVYMQLFVIDVFYSWMTRPSAQAYGAMTITINAT